MTEDRTNTVTPMDPRPSSPSDILEELVNTLRASLMPAPPPLPSASASPMAIPAAYVGDSAECGGFLLQLALYIEMQPQKFHTERSKVAFLISLLSGRALSWARAIWNTNTAIIDSYEAFINHFKEVFGSATGALTVSDQLLRLLKALPPPTSTRWSFVLWRQLVVGTKRLSSAPISRDWKLVSALRWRYMMIP